MITVKEAKTRKEIKEFVEFPNKLYKDNPYYSPCTTSDEIKDLLPETNPAFEYCEAKVLMAYKDGKLVGRMCAIINHAYNKKWNKKRIRFNRFDVIDDIEVTKALVEYTKKWGRENGLNEITGPIGFCDMDKQGLLVEGFDELDMYITAYNADYYMKHLEALGFVKDADWVEFLLSVPEELDPRIVKVANGMMRRGNLHEHPFKKIKEILPRVDEIFALLNQAYAGLYGTVELNSGQVQFYKDHYISMLDPDYVSVILNENDEIVGFGAAIPSMAKAMQKAKGRYFPFGWIHMLKALAKNDTIELLLVAVRDDYRNKGVNAMLISKIYRNAVKNGIKFAETGPELELNDKVQSQWKNFDARQHKRRRCYVAPIEE